MDLIKEAFSKIKEDIISLRDEISNLKTQIKDIKIIQTHNPTQTLQQTDKQTHNPSFSPNSTHNLESSIGNKGVPTDKQNRQQTNRHKIT